MERGTRGEGDGAVFGARRDRVLAALGEDAAMVLAAAPEVVVGRDLELRYRVDPDLWYLTGYPEPEAVAVLRPGADESFTLFVRDRDAERERWTGPRIGVTEAGERYDADAAHPVARLGERLPGLLADADRVYFRLGAGRPDVEAAVLGAIRGGRAGRQRSGRGPAILADPGLLLDDLRLIKEPGEIDAIRDAIRITIDAFREGLRAARPGAGEWVVEATVDAAFRRAGADGPAFATIAASGPNATVLHYIDNHRVIEAGDLLLLDAGARHRIYNADLTRTIPVGGTFSGPQADVHRIVRDAERAAIQAVRPGATIDAIHRAALQVLVRGMADLGLLQGDADAWAQRAAEEDPDARAASEGNAGHTEGAAGASGAGGSDAAGGAGAAGGSGAAGGGAVAPWKRWFPHKTSHWLGLDVHDVGTYATRGGPRPLEPGMVLTVEPGLYIPPGADDAPAHLRGIGVRIEDDILVTPDGHEVLSADLPVDPREILAS